MIIAVDFDGTLCTEEYPKIGKPIEHNIYLVQILKKLGHILILYTCRADKYLDAAIKWCAEHGLVFDYINENASETREKYKLDCRKISADIYLDDKCVNLDESRFSYIQEILERAMAESPLLNKKEKKPVMAKICEDCIHKDLCKYAEAMGKKETELKLEAPFELHCKQKQTHTLTYPSTNPYPWWPDGIRGIGTTRSKCTWSDSCGYWINGKCTAPNNIAGLPCQQILCTAVAADMTPEAEAKLKELKPIIEKFNAGKTVSAPNSACLAH